MPTWEANGELVRNDVELVPISAADGRIATEGALPCTTGVLWQRGLEWRETQVFFLALEAGSTSYPALSRRPPASGGRWREARSTAT
jgi:ornithine decarboxylase